MKKKREYGDYFDDVVEAMKEIESFVKSMNYDDFINDRKTVFAVERGIEIIGEATKNIPKSIRSKYPEVPWKDMAGMRDRISHVYHDVDLELVWKVIKQEIPSLKIMLSDILAELNDENIDK
jgi:uncharacterized protein with HEPN domain